jgi:hypothetical protein
MRQENDRLTIRIGAPTGDPASVPKARQYSVKIYDPRTPRSVRIGEASADGRAGDASAGQGWSHDGVFLHVSAKPQPMEVSLQY